MNPWEILVLALIVVVAVAIFALIIRNDNARVRAGTAEAEAKGEPVKKRPPLGVIYFALGAAFIVVGIFTLLGH